MKRDKSVKKEPTRRLKNAAKSTYRSNFVDMIHEDVPLLFGDLARVQIKHVPAELLDAGLVLARSESSNVAEPLSNLALVRRRRNETRLDVLIVSFLSNGSRGGGVLSG